VLSSIGRDLTYEKLLPVSSEMDIGAGIRVHVLNLETIIAVKESIDGEKDRLALPVLRRTLREKKDKNDGGPLLRQLRRRLRQP